MTLSDIKTMTIITLKKLKMGGLRNSNHEFLIYVARAVKIGIVDMTEHSLFV